VVRVDSTAPTFAISLASSPEVECDATGIGRSSERPNGDRVPEQLLLMKFQDDCKENKAGC
jgi:hypothetical protein